MKWPTLIEKKSVFKMQIAGFSSLIWKLEIVGATSLQ
jgi:hypothetical protein